MEVFIEPKLYVIVIWNLQGDKLHRGKGGRVWCSTEKQEATDVSESLRELGLTAEVLTYGKS